MNHCNQSNVPILSKFRGDDNLSGSSNAMTPKYNGHNNSNISNNPYQSNVPTFTPSSHLHTNNDDKQRLPNSYQPSNTSNAQLHQSPEITQDICNALLNQQTDAKRGKCFCDSIFISFRWKLSLCVTIFFLLSLFRNSVAKCEFWLAVSDTKFSCCC